MIAPGRDAKHWRQWGFLRHPIPETTALVLQNPLANPIATNQTTPPNTSQHHIPANTNLQANLAQWNTNCTQQLGMTPNTQRHQAQADIQNPITENGKAQDNSSVPQQANTNPNQPLDNYLSPWCDHFQQPKPPNTFRICLQNFGGWPMSAKAQKNNNICCFVNSAEVSIFLTTENNMAWHKIPAQHHLHKQTCRWWESLHITMANNMMDPHSSAYQPGGVGVFSINHVAHCIQSFGSDPTGLGFYCWMLLTGRNNKKLWVVAAYHLSKSNNGHLSVMQQHWRYFAQNNQADNIASTQEPTSGPTLNQ